MKNIYLISILMSTFLCSAQRKPLLIDKLLNQMQTEISFDITDSIKTEYFIKEIYLNSDSIIDFAIAEKEMCGGTGNCFWDLYITHKKSEIQFLHVGMLPASSFELIEDHEHDFKRIKAFWKDSAANDGEWTISEFQESKYQVICSGRYFIKGGIKEMKGISDCKKK